MKIESKTRRTLFALAACALALPVAVRAEDAATGGMAGGTAMSGGMMMDSGMAMTPMAVSGMIVRQYVDMMGNITSVDVQTANGVQQVRFATAVPSTDARFATLGKGSMLNETGVTTPGIVSYSPDGPMVSGLAMSGSGGMMAGGGMTGGAAGGAMPMSMMPNTTMNLTGATTPPSQYGALVSLADGRFTVIRSMNGQMMFVNPDNGMMSMVTSDNMMMPKGMKMMKGTRVMTLSPDGMMVMNTMGGEMMGDKAGMMSGGTMSTDTSGTMPK